jgi:peptidyl-tRNA hydrolase
VESGDDPLVMTIVVRRRTSRPFAELAVATALVTRRCADRYRTDERWAQCFGDWWRDSFRKVCLRAEPRDWEDVRALDHERVGDVACLPPRHRSQRERVLVRMQALAGEADGLPSPSPPQSGELLLVVNTSLPMSAGKTLAQIGHGALMVPLGDDTFGIRVCGAEGRAWEDACAEAISIVRDGGLTEVPRGSETVAVLAQRP